jgi:hypothetical protein
LVGHGGADVITATSYLRDVSDQLRRQIHN